MRYVRTVAGLLAWMVAGVMLFLWLRGYIFAPREDGHRVATDLWNYASAERRIVKVQLDDAWPVEVGDPIFRVDGSDSIEQVGEIRRVVTGVEAAQRRVTTGPAAEALLYPNAPVLCSESYLTYYTTPRSMSWVMETMLPPEKRFEIAQEILVTYEAYHAEILDAIKPVIVGGVLDAMEVVEEDLVRAIDGRREELEGSGAAIRIGSSSRRSSRWCARRSGRL